MKIKILSIFTALILFIGCEYIYLDSSKTYNLRDRGPAGGLIFYINPNAKTDGWRYMEASPVENAVLGIRWDIDEDSDGFLLTNATDQTIGSGPSNTTKIVSIIGSPSYSYAAKICVDYRGGGYSDWYLPSKDELYLMFRNLYKFNSGNFINGYYWSSSETDSDEASNILFDPGTSEGGSSASTLKSSLNSIRAARRF